MAKIQITNYEAFAKDFIEEYLSRGLGALGKRDIDILVMHLLETYGNTRLKGNQDLSIDLQTDVSTIKLLRYKAKLRYPPKDTAFVARDFLYVLALAQFEADKGRLVFIIEDSFIRNVIQGRLKTQGALFDSSFNSEIFKVRLEHLKPILNAYYDKSIADSFVKDMNKIVAKEGKLKFSEIKNAFVLGAAKGLGASVVTLVKGLLSQGVA
ncbi:MAG: hypothetical protein PHW08_02615 [Kiritimatiellae bacterium]|nr:hypothetical protein [Kiritimatiellia bacterium]